MSPEQLEGHASVSALRGAEQLPSEAGERYGGVEGRSVVNCGHALAVERADASASGRAQRGPTGADALPCLNSHNSGSAENSGCGALGQIKWKTEEQIWAAQSGARRRAFKLSRDMRGFFEAVGLERVLMLELTHGKDGPKRLARKWDRLAKNGGLPWLRDWGRITEPHMSGAAHFHFVVEAPEGMDVRSGFDFTALAQADAAAQARNWPECAKWTKAYSASAHPWLRAQWLRLRTLARRYGFGGRCRLVPVRTCAKAVSHYVAKYLAKCLANDLGPQWKGVRRVEWARKAAFKPRRKVSSQFAWAGIVSKLGPKHRDRVDQIARALGLGRDDMEGLRRIAGPRWAYHWREQLRGTDEEFARFLREVPLRARLLRPNRTGEQNQKP